MKPSVVYGLKLSAAAVLAGACVLSAGAAALTLGGGSELMDLAGLHENRAEALLAESPPNTEAAVAETKAALAQGADERSGLGAAGLYRPQPLDRHDPGGAGQS